MAKCYAGCRGECCYPGGYYSCCGRSRFRGHWEHCPKRLEERYGLTDRDLPGGIFDDREDH